LTNGQETHGITYYTNYRLYEEHLVVGQDPANPDDTITADQLDPTDPDTDGDGYWDGWIGVHGVGRSDTVILYREHLEDGITADGRVNETVPQQARTHPVTDDPMTASATEVDIDGDGTPEHSNVHIGELHWAQNDPSQSGNPVTDATTPNPSLTVEVDYDESVADLDIINRIEQASDTYYLYGMEVNYRFDEEIQTLAGNLDPTRISPGGASINENVNHDNTDFTYMFITRNGGGSDLGSFTQFNWTRDPQGVASCQGNDLRCDLRTGGGFELLGFGTLVFTQDIYNSLGDPDQLATKTIVHETGHLLGAGRADDGSVTDANVLPVEVYSGTDEDATPEELRNGGLDAEWSVMSEGWTNGIAQSAIADDHVPYSIEELSTIELNNVDTID